MVPGCFGFCWNAGSGPRFGARAGSGSGSNTSSTTSGSGSGSSTAVKEKFGNFGDHFSGVGGSSFASANF